MADIAVLAVFYYFIYSGYRKGLSQTVMKVANQILSLIFTVNMKPTVSKMIRKTEIYQILKQYISKSIGLNDVIATQQRSIINHLNLPDFLKQSLHINNNPEAYNVLNASGIEDYISSYLANICINILSLIIVYVVIRLGLRIFTDAIDLISKLPVLKQLNKIGGAALGIVQGIIVIWIIFTILTFFLSFPAFSHMYDHINKSVIASRLYQTNILQSTILKIFA